VQTRKAAPPAGHTAEGNAAPAGECSWSKRHRCCQRRAVGRGSSDLTQMQRLAQHIDGGVDQRLRTSGSRLRCSACWPMLPGDGDYQGVPPDLRSGTRLVPDRCRLVPGVPGHASPHGARNGCHRTGQSIRLVSKIQSYAHERSPRKAFARIALAVCSITRLASIRRPITRSAVDCNSEVWRRISCCSSMGGSGITSP
jgi:hypothetical protein